MNSRTQLSYTNSILAVTDAGKITRKEAASMLLALDTMWTPADPNCGSWTNAELKLHLESLGVKFDAIDEDFILEGDGPDIDSASHWYELHRDTWGVAPTLHTAYCAGKGWNCYAPTLQGCVELAWEYYAEHISPAYWLGTATASLEQEAA